LAPLPPALLGALANVANGTGGVFWVLRIWWER
jgi:hypothetical protein